MLKTILFILYAVMIPVVPLLGTMRYDKENDNKKRLACWGLFTAQSLVSAAYIIAYLGQA